MCLIFFLLCHVVASKTTYISNHFSCSSVVILTRSFETSRIKFVYKDRLDWFDNVFFFIFFPVCVKEVQTCVLTLNKQSGWEKLMKVKTHGKALWRIKIQIVVFFPQNMVTTQKECVLLIKWSPFFWFIKIYMDCITL